MTDPVTVPEPEETPVDDQPTGDAAPAPAEPLDKSDLVAAAIARGIPSYEAWAMTDADLTARLES